MDRQLQPLYFSTGGNRYFMPREGSRPFSGEKGELNRVKEFRLETVLPLSLKALIIRALLESHPYEEVAYDLYELAREGVPPLGLGRVGTLKEPLTLDKLAARCKKY